MLLIDVTRLWVRRHIQLNGPAYLIVFLSWSQFQPIIVTACRCDGRRRVTDANGSRCTTELPLSCTATPTIASGSIVLATGSPEEDKKEGP